MSQDVRIVLKADDQQTRVFKQAGSAATAYGQQVEQAGERGARALAKQRAAMSTVGAASGVLLAGVSRLSQAHVAEERQIEAVRRAYGSQADQLLDLTDRLQDMGVASDDAARISVLGAQSLARNYGLTADQIEQLTLRSADLAAVSVDTNGQLLGLADVSQRVTAAIRGEAESAEILGVAMNDTRLATLAAEAGLTGWTTTMTDAEKAQFRFQVLLDDTAHAQGAAAAQTEGWAGKLRALKLELGDVASSAGSVLGPAAQVVSTVGEIGLGLTGLSLAAKTVGPLLGGGTGIATGLTAVGTAAAPLLATMTALAAPIGIATYLIADQDNVMRRAAEATAENNEQLQKYIAWLNQVATVDVDPLDFQGTEGDRLLDFFRDVNRDVLLTRDGINGVTVPMSNLRDEVNRLDPANFQAVLDVARNWGIVWSDPSTWSTEGLNEVAWAITSLTRTEQDAAITAMNANQTRQRGIVAIDDATASVDRLNRAEAGQVATSREMAAARYAEIDAARLATDEEKRRQVVTEDAIERTRLYIAEQNKRGEAVNAALAAELAGLTRITEAYESLSGRDLDLGVLANQAGAVSIEVGLDTAGAVADLERIYQVGVGNLKSIGSTVSGIQQWGEELIGVEGTYGKIDDLLAAGVIDQTQWNRAQRSYTSIAADNLTIQENLLSIQAQQAPVVARQVDVLDAALRKVEGMDQASQAAALGFMDAGEQARFLELQTSLTAAATGQLGESGQRSMEMILGGIQATDPYLISMAEKAGLIKIDDSTGTLTVNWEGIDEDGSSPLDKLVDQMATIARGLEVALEVDINDDGVEEWQPPEKELPVKPVVREGADAPDFDPLSWPVDLKVTEPVWPQFDPITVAVEPEWPQYTIEPPKLENMTATIDVDNKPAFTAIQAAAEQLAYYGGLIGTAKVDADNGPAATSIGDVTAQINAWGGLSVSATAGVVDNASGVLGNVSSLLGGLDGRVATSYVETVYTERGGPSGRAPTAYATGGVVRARMAEVGPESVTIPGSAMRAIAPSDGLYDVPEGSYVSPAVASRGGRGYRSGREGIHIHGSVYITAATPDIHDALNAQTLGQSRR